MYAEVRTVILVAFSQLVWLMINSIKTDRSLHTCPNIKFSSPVSINTTGLREALWEFSVFPKNTTQCPQLGQALTRIAWTRDESTNHDTTAPPTCSMSSTNFTERSEYLDSRDLSGEPFDWNFIGLGKCLSRIKKHYWKGVDFTQSPFYECLIE